VPQDVCEITFDAVGANGGPGGDGAPGGSGGETVATVVVSAGQSYTVGVGGAAAPEIRFRQPVGLAGPVAAARAVAPFYSPELAVAVGAGLRRWPSAVSWRWSLVAGAAGAAA